MFDESKVFLGIAPIGWCNDDMPELGAENTFKQIVSEMALAGFTGCEGYTADAFELKLTSRGTVDAQEGSYRTSAEKVFSAGDMRRGQSLVVWAIAEGRACAAEVDRYLMGYTNMRVS